MLEGAAAGCTAAEDVVDCVGAGCEAAFSPPLLGAASGCSAAGSDSAASSAGAGAAAGCSTSMVYCCGCGVDTLEVVITVTQQ